MADDSTYRLLHISRGATREEIESACLRLWYRHRMLNNTPLWEDLSRQIERMRASLLEASERPRHLTQTQDNWAPIQEPSRARPCLISAGVTAVAFNLMIQHTRPDQWVTVGNLFMLSFLLGCCVGTFALSCINILANLQDT